MKHFSPKLFPSILFMLLPWPLRRLAMNFFLGYRIHPTAHIGFSMVAPDHLVMDEYAYIGHFNVVKGQALVHIHHHSGMGQFNWVTATPVGTRYYLDEPDRVPRLVLQEYTSIISRHLIDCTNAVEIGHHTTLAGFRSQILTHGIDIAEPRQQSAPVTIGNYCLVGSGCIILAGARLPDCCVLGAGSLLNRPLEQPYTLYAGVPAIAKKQLDPQSGYFTREQGHVA